MKPPGLIFDRAAYLIIFILLTGLTAVIAAPADLDMSFGGTGKTRIGFGFDADRAYGLARQPDLKILIAGAGTHDFALVRYNSDGALDPSFDGDGKVTTRIGGSSNGRPLGLPNWQDQLPLRLQFRRHDQQRRRNDLALALRAVHSLIVHLRVQPSDL